MLLLSFPRPGVSFVCGVLHNLLKILWVHSIHDVKEVLPAGNFLISVLVLEEDAEVLLALEVLPQILHRQLLEVGDMDVIHLFLLQQPLLVGKNLPEKILVDLCFWRQIILY